MAALTLAGCGGGGGGGPASGVGGPPPPGGGSVPGGGGGGGGTLLSEGATAARIKMSLPDMDTFVVRATIPVPYGTYPRSDGKQPFGIVDSDNNTYGAQAEIVSRFADPDGGANVVEVIGVVNKPAGANTGDEVTYDVVLASHDPRPAPGSPDVSDLQNGPLGVPTDVQNFLGDPNSIIIRSYDCFGNKYEVRPLDGTGAQKLTRYGEHQAEIRNYQTLMPAPAVGGSNGTLPHFFSTHTYLSTLNGETILPMDLKVSNGHSGKDAGSIEDDPLDEIYFSKIEVLVPNGWTVVQAYDDPYFGAPYVEGGMTVHPIVNPNSPGQGLHWMPWLGQFNRHLAICGLGEESRALEYLTGGGIGFSERGDDGEGNELWSWWNDLTPYYFPQQHILPSLDHMGNQTENYLTGEFNKALGHLNNGTASGLYPYIANAWGWAHPYGIAYGGMTGGAEINIFDGIMTVNAASRNGYQLHRITHRMATDRQPTAMFDLDGDASSVQTWVTSGGGITYVPFEMWSKPIGSGDPFGLNSAPQFQIQHVQATGQEAWYKNSLENFLPHDYQHLIRYTRSPKVLIYLANDTLAKDDVRIQAENWNLAYHEFFNNSGGYMQGSGMAYDIDQVGQHPGKGVDFGRGEAWGLDAVNVAYATSDDAFRAGKITWYFILAQMLEDGQGDCNGFIQATISNQFVSGLYRARQMIEQSITENSIRGMTECVFRNEYPAWTAMMETVNSNSLYASISDMAWFPGETGPWMKAAVGPLDVNQPIWCSWTQMPGDSYVPYYDTFQNWTSFAYGYEVGGDTTFLDFASTQAWNNDLLAQLEADGLSNIENKAGLLALMQWLNGDI